MNKYEFLYKLNQSLEHCSNTERQEIVHYYDELIQDAIDSGESEAEFIDKLGSVDKITRTIKKDQDFVTNVKEKKDYQLQKVFSVTVKIIGYFIFFILMIVIGSIGISLVASGGGTLVFAGIRIYEAVIKSLSAATIIMYAGSASIGLGLVLIGFWVFKSLFVQSKNQLEKLMEFIQSKIKKEGQ
ncbi:MAG: DUF1700 domain-containing protein [Candidatus Izemoplasmatales bacterium]|jgi:uncharacterized membrane protein|nr:DUF1700 domain-containing protein [Candidatus Izemoplasmatales bacterium]MDD3865355.1 DUF1700 domain-containing protein [Candidatus Izemoplasmatales bacterium]